MCMYVCMDVYANEWVKGCVCMSMRIFMHRWMDDCTDE